MNTHRHLSVSQVALVWNSVISGCADGFLGICLSYPGAFDISIHFIKRLSIRNNKNEESWIAQGPCNGLWSPLPSGHHSNSVQVDSGQKSVPADSCLVNMK